MAIVKTTDAEFGTLLQDNEKVIVKFYADWCGSCKLFAPKFRRLSDDERFAGIAFLDVNAEENPETRKQAGVTNLPFFAVYKGGNLVETLSASKEESVVELLGKLN
ncbi:MAG: thioredoxin family protein [Flexibacteraceae bacterium]